MTCAQFPPSPARSVGEGGAKRRMRAGALERDGASGKTAPLRFAALIRPSGTLYGAFFVKGFVVVHFCLASLQYSPSPSELRRP